MDWSAELSGVLSHRIAELHELANATERFLRAFDVPEHTIFQINLAVEELVSNTINHGSRDGEQSAIRVALSMTDGEIVVRIEDEAPPFDPFARAPVDTAAAVEARPIGGLGIHLVKEMIDRVEYRRVDGRNHVTLRQPFAPAREVAVKQDAE